MVTTHEVFNQPAPLVDTNLFSANRYTGTDRLEGGQALVVIGVAHRDPGVGDDDVGASVERVESVRGGGSTTFASQAPGAVINYISHTGQKEGGFVQLSKGVNYDETFYTFYGQFTHEGQGQLHTLALRHQLLRQAGEPQAGGVGFRQRVEIDHIFRHQGPKNVEAGAGVDLQVPGNVCRAFWCALVREGSK